VDENFHPGLMVAPSIAYLSRSHLISGNKQLYPVIHQHLPAKAQAIFIPIE
jgi:hypothetical protein